MVVLGCHARVTDEDLSTLRNLNLVFGTAYMQRAVIVFTHGDLLEQGATLLDYLSGSSEEVSHLLGSAKGGCIAVNAMDPLAGSLLIAKAIEVAGALPRPRG